MDDWEKIIDSAEPDPRVRAKARGRMLYCKHNYHTEQRKQAAEEGMMAYGREVRDLINCDLSFEDACSRLDMELQRIASGPRRPGEPKPWTREGEVEDNRGAFDSYVYPSLEREHVQRMLQPDERIVSIGFWNITTSMRSISRDEIRAY